MDDFYRDDAGLCRACPVAGSTGSRIESIVLYHVHPLLGGIVVVVVLVNLAIRRAVQLRGGTLLSARAHAREFALWCIIALQKIAQAAHSIYLPSLPDYIRTLFDYLVVSSSASVIYTAFVIVVYVCVLVCV